MKFIDLKKIIFEEATHNCLRTHLTFANKSMLMKHNLIAVSKVRNVFTFILKRILMYKTSINIDLHIRLVYTFYKWLHFIKFNKIYQ